MTNFLITLFLGWAGVHKFVEGKIGIGFLYLFTVGLFGIGWFIDIIIAAANIPYSNKTSGGQNSLPSPNKISNEQNSLPSPSIQEASSVPDNAERAKIEGHNVAGTSFRQSEIESLGTKNPYFSMNKKQLIAANMVEKSIYQYIFEEMECELIPEPENEHDPNAVKVVVRGVHIGYIKRGSCPHVNKLISSDSIESVSAFIYGGKYKRVCQWAENGRNVDEDYELDRDVSDYRARIEIRLRNV